MKFGEEYKKKQNAKYEGRYINYDALKSTNLKISNLDIVNNNDISILCSNTSFLYENEKIFVKLLNSEMERCTLSIKAEYEKIVEKIKGDYLLEELIKSLCELEEFVNLNKIAIYKILKKHDKYTNIKYSRSFFINEMIKKMYDFDFDNIIIQINKQKTQIQTVSTQNNLFVRKSSKFLVDSKNITKVKLLLASVFPIIYYHQNKNIHYQTISSIYFAIGFISLIF